MSFTFDALLKFLAGLLEFLIAFGALVFLHEFGHYITSKLFGVEVEEFGFGFPPRLVKLFQFGETEFTLNWIPFGAFVRPKGENDPAIPGGLAAANPWARLVVLFGGSFMNLLIGLLLFSILFSITGIQVIESKNVAIIDVNAGSPAAQAGMQADDLILRVNDTTIDSTTTLAQVIKANLGKEIIMQLKRGEETLEVRTVPRTNPPEDEGALGIIMTDAVKAHYEPKTFLQAIPYAVQDILNQGRQLISLPVQLLRGQLDPSEARMMGPKGIYDLYQYVRELDQKEMAAAQPAQNNGLNRLKLLAVLSVALGFANLLPIPALDGGRILFVLPEILFRRRIPAQYENTIHLVGFFLLILVMILVTQQDFVNPITDSLK